MSGCRGCTIGSAAAAVAGLLLAGCLPIPLPGDGDSPVTAVGRQIEVGRTTAADLEVVRGQVGQTQRYDHGPFIACIGYRRRFVLWLLPIGPLVFGEVDALGITLDADAVVTDVEHVHVADWDYVSTCCGGGPLPPVCFANGLCWDNGTLAPAGQPATTAAPAGAAEAGGVRQP